MGGGLWSMVIYPALWTNHMGWVSARPRPATWFLPRSIPWVTGEVLAACRHLLVPWLGQQHSAASCWLSLPAHN